MPFVCAILVAVMLLISHLYLKRCVEILQQQSTYFVRTYSVMLNRSIEEAKDLANTLSLDSGVRELTSGDRTDPDYARELSETRAFSDKVSAFYAQAEFIPNIYVAGKNGYHYDFAHMARRSVMEEGWFQDRVDPDLEGFQYILPFTTEKPGHAKSATEQAAAVVLPIRNKREISGYVVCLISMKELGQLPSTYLDEESQQVYLVRDDLSEYYDFSEGEVIGDFPDFLKDMEISEEGSFREGNLLTVYHRIDQTDWMVAETCDYRELRNSVLDVFHWSIVLILIGMIVMLLVSLYASVIIRKPIDDVVDRIREIAADEKFGMRPIIHPEKIPDEVLLIRQSLEKMSGQIHELLDKVYLSQIYERNMEYESLVNQINPHFLFNTLQMIQARAVEEDCFEVSDMIVALSRMIRYNIAGHERFVTVSEECSYTESYLELMHMRFPEKFEFEIDHDPDLGEARIMKFSLQPLVENSIRHGLKAVKTGGRVRISLKKEKEESSGESYILVQIRDNGAGMPADRLAEVRAKMYEESDSGKKSVGLHNTCMRLSYAYGKKAQMTIDSREGEGTSITMRMPVRLRNEEISDTETSPSGAGIHDGEQLSEAADHV